MSEFQVINENRYPMDVQESMLQVKRQIRLPYHRWEHRVTLGYNGKEYMVFLDNGIPHRNIFPNIYIEEITASGLEYIDDEPLHASLLNFAQVNGYMNILAPLKK